jgi:YVTN family beta-propeller protein
MTIPAVLGATDLQITPDGAFIYVNNSAAQSVTVIDTQTLTGTTLNVGAAPQGSTLVPVQ